MADVKGFEGEAGGIRSRAGKPRQRTPGDDGPWGVDLAEACLGPIHLELRKAQTGPLRNREAVDLSLRGHIRKAVGDTLRDRWKAFEVAADSSAPSRRAVLFWPRELNHLDEMLPVARALRRRGLSAHVVSCHRNVFRACLEQGEKACFLPQEFPSVDPVALAAASKPWAWRRRVGARAGNAEADAESVVARTIRACGAIVARTCGYTDSLVSAFDPEGFVVGNDLTLEGRTTALVARERGIRSFAIMHGQVTGSELQGRHIVDRFLVFGERPRRVLLRLGNDAEQVVVVGCPSLRCRPEQTGRVEPRLRERLGLRQGDGWVLVALSGPGHSVSLNHHRAITEALRETAVRNPNVRIVAKLHPKDSVDHYKGWTRDPRMSGPLVVVQDAEGLPTTIRQWLQGCPLLITGGSASAVDAFLLSVPVLTIDLRDELRGFDFIEEGATFHVRDRTAIGETLRAILSREPWTHETLRRSEAYLSDFFHFPADGSDEYCAKRILDDLEAAHGCGER